MKRIILFFTFTFFFFITFAQLHIKAGLTGNFANGKMADYWVGGPGAEGNVKYLIANKYAIGISSGYQHFFAKYWGEGYSDMGLDVVPIRLSLAYYLGKGPFRVYFGTEIGHNITVISYLYTYYVYGPYYSYYANDRYKNSEGRFGVAPLFGIHIDLGRVVALDIGHKLNFISKIDDNSPKQNASYIGTNIGLVIKIGEKRKQE